MFNYLVDRTRPWCDSKSDLLGDGFQNYETRFPLDATEGLILDLN
jgi:hypothetical protein